MIVLSSFSARLRSSILRAGLELVGPPPPPNVSTPSTVSVILVQLTTHFSLLRLIVASTAVTALRRLGGLTV